MRYCRCFAKWFKQILSLTSTVSTFFGLPMRKLCKNLNFKTKKSTYFWSPRQWIRVRRKCNKNVIHLKDFVDSVWKNDVILLDIARESINPRMCFVKSDKFFCQYYDYILIWFNAAFPVINNLGTTRHMITTRHIFA